MIEPTLPNLPETSSSGAVGPTVPQADLAGLLCSRLCHDLMSPVGALSNGLELLADEQDPSLRTRYLGLIEQSARISADKLRFFRIAFGASGDGGSLPSAQARTLVEGLVGSEQRIALGWAIEDAELPKPAGKLLLNLALIGVEALVRGGTLDIGAEREGERYEIVVSAAGPRIAFDPAIGRALDGGLPAEGLSSKLAPAVLARALAARHGGAVRYALSEEALVLGAEFRAG